MVSAILQPIESEKCASETLVAQHDRQSPRHSYFQAPAFQRGRIRGDQEEISARGEVLFFTIFLVDGIPGTE